MTRVKMDPSCIIFLSSMTTKSEKVKLKTSHVKFVDIVKCVKMRLFFLKRMIGLG